MRIRGATNEVVLVCKQVEFYSAGDEANFFRWAKELKCIKKVQGIGDEIRLHIRSSRVSDSCLRELIGLLFRYKIEMKQLQQFLNPSNAHWFDDREFWFHKLIFSTFSKSRK